METTKPCIFVYGTLRHAYARLPTSLRRLNPPSVLHTTGTYIGTTNLPHFGLFDVGDYPGILPCENASVVGDLFQVESELVLEVLDEYEGIGGLYEIPYEYRREQIRVDMDGKEMLAWVYVYNWNLGKVQWIRGGDYVQHCIGKIRARADTDASCSEEISG